MPYPKNSDLPDPVKNALPEAAQSIYRGAFNGALEQGLGEERAAKIAWTAVKRKYKKSGETWVAKDESDITMDGVDLEEVLVLDDAGSGIRMTKDGYLVANPRVARTGIQLYRGWELGDDSRDVIRVYRPEREVFHVDSLATYTGRPVTNSHPPVQVNATNWRDYSVGNTGENVLRDKEFIRVPLVLMDSRVINDFREGKRQLSLGYTSEIVWQSGVTDSNEAYDAIQTNIRANHLAVVTTARGGPKLKIGDSDEGERDMPKHVLTIDGASIPVECDDVSASVITRALGTMQNTITGLNAKIAAAEAATEAEKKASAKKAGEDAATIATKDGEIAALNKKVTDATMTPEKIDALVADRMGIVSKARAILGDKYDITGKTNSAIMRDVCVAKMGEPEVKNLKDEGIEGAFRVLTAGTTPAPGAGHSVNDLAASFRTVHSSGGAAAAAKSWMDEGNRLKDAWKNVPTQATQ